MNSLFQVDWDHIESNDPNDNSNPGIFVIHPYDDEDSDMLFI